MKLLIYSLFISVVTLAQQVETDIWLFKLSKKEGKYIYSNPLNITHRIGYDNQPAFSAYDKSIYYVRIDSTKQADIYKFDISKNTHLNLTKSDVSEFSPTLLPNGKGFSTVVVEKDSAQRVWCYNLDGSFNKILFADIDSIGYHTWLNADSMIYYKLTEPHSLRVVDSKGKDVWITDAPTRAFKKMNHAHLFLYGIKVKDVIHYRVYNTSLKESKLFAVHPSSAEDFIWNPEFGLIKSDGADLFKYNEQSKQWEVLFSFSSLGIKKITRFVFDSKNKQLALVVNDER